MAASTKDKFDAAVNVIKSLPKDGSFQPSQELMLLFYSYFKQATEGPCSAPKPSFWEVVKKAKWDAWNKLGNMSREEAMLSYVEELKKIIETMPQTQMVAEFMETLGTFYELVEERPLYNGQVKSERDKSDGIDRSGAVDEMNLSRELSLQLAAVEEEIRQSAVSLADSETEVPVTPANHISPEIKQNSDTSVTKESSSVDAQLFISEQNKANVVAEDGGPVSRAVEGHGDVLSRGITDEVVSESDGEEFCDSTDQIQTTVSHLESRPNPSENPSSTPRRPLPVSNPSSGQGSSRVPISTRGKLPFSPIVPRISQLRNVPLSDSLTVNSPGEESLNTSLDVPNVYLDSESPEDPPHLLSQSQAAGLQMTAVRTDFCTSDKLSSRELFGHPGNMNEHISVTLARLQQDTSSILRRMDSLERLSRQQTKQSMWWPIPNVSRQSLFFVVVWPFLVHWLLKYLSRRRRR